MKFLVYTVKPLSQNAPLDSFVEGGDEDLSRVAHALEQMDFDRVMENDTVQLLVDNDSVKIDDSTQTVIADIYKDANRGSALHQLKKTDSGMNVQEVLSKHEDAFEKGICGLRKIDETVYLVVQKNFGSYLLDASVGLDIEPRYSSEAVRSIQKSESIGDTSFDFAEGHNLTASLVKPPEDGDLRDENGFGFSDPINKVLAMLNVSEAHRISMSIDQETWVDNIDSFEDIIQSEIVTSIRVEDTTHGVVRIGDGGDRAIRESIKTNSRSHQAVTDALDKIEE